ncbi:MAG: hypothetical protein A2Y33_11485 [Spirochaetes bacterium GWF1_51_8]|nr:MAG: hypothetical protein A2Y33_11485 [Spirochaetes bacterium GWF1_51_8]
MRRKMMIVFLGVFTISAVTAQEAGPSVVEVKKGGYSLEMPADWPVKDKDIKAGNIVSTIPIGDGITLEFRVMKAKGKYDALKKDLAKNFKKEYFKANELGKGEIKTVIAPVCQVVNGLELCSAVMQYAYKYHEYRVYFGVFKTKAGVYKVFFVCKADAYDYFFDQAKIPLGSLKALQ